MQTMKIDGVDFNVDLVKKMTVKVFCEHDMHANHWPHLTGAERDKAIRAAYFTLTGTKDKKETAAE